MRTSKTLGVTLIILAAFTVLLLAQSGDTPIIISDGSLKINSLVPWSQYGGSGDSKSHPHGTKAISSIDVTMNGSTSTVAFRGESCRVEVTYDSDRIVFSSEGNRKGLRMFPFSKFRQGADANTIEHNNQGSKISHVTITKDGAAAVDADANGNTRIVIHFK